MVAQVMGVVNVTPDSFSDGGRFVVADEIDHVAAIAHGLAQFAAGAAVVDVGGESTRPGATAVDAAEELRRVLPVVEALAATGRVSIDTRHATVARAAVAAGASLVNDISGALWPVAADLGVGWVCMHMQGEPASMQIAPHYDDVVSEVTTYLVAQAEQALAAGVDEVWIDPGLGFGKLARHNLALLARLDTLVATGFPVLVGASRKAFLGRLSALSDAAVGTSRLPGLGTAAGIDPNDLDAIDTTAPTPVDDRIDGSLAVAAWAAHCGARLIRVHDVRPTIHAVTLVGDATTGERAA